VKQSDGTLRFEDRPELVNGRNVPVVYNLFNRRRSKNTVIVSDGCVVMMRPLFPRQSVVFAIPVDDFKNRADVAVQFNYPWEDDGGREVGGEFGHYAFFRNELLPKGVIR
jgi:hypothetical protein